MTHTRDLILTAATPIIWGSSYITTTQMLPDGYPLTAALLRVLPAGLLLLLLVRQLPPTDWIARVFVLGFFNFALFMTCLFFAAYHLPGGVAATLGAVQPLIVLVLAQVMLGAKTRPLAYAGALVGLLGVAMLILGPEASLNPVGVVIALLGAVSMALGVVLTRRWHPPVSPLTFTAWQLTAGGILLLPIALFLEPSLPPLTLANVGGFLWLGLIGGAFAYFLWFRGIGRLGPTAVTGLGFLSPLSAVLLGWVILGEALTPVQGLGALLVLGSVWASARLNRPTQAPIIAPLAAAAAKL